MLIRPCFTTSITQSNGGFGTSGSPQIQATSSDLTITLNTSADGFNFAGNSGTIPAAWIYTFPAQTLLFVISADQQFT